ncbi:protein phosphatase 2a regulatory b subunit, partial [Moniliophthora roreri]
MGGRPIRRLKICLKMAAVRVVARSAPSRRPPRGGKQVWCLRKRSKAQATHDARLRNR